MHQDAVFCYTQIWNQVDKSTAYQEVDKCARMMC